jgi:thioredoxin-like negative regulator of GroEL
LSPDNGRIQAELGVVRLLSGDVDGAADALVNSRALEPDRQTTTFLLAMARLGQHRVDDARALLAAVPPSDPYYKAAQERLKTLATSAR